MRALVTLALLLAGAASAGAHHVGVYTPRDNEITTNFKQIKFSLQAKRFEVALRFFEQGALRAAMHQKARSLPPGLDEDGSVWALRTLVLFCAAAGFVVGWVMARAIGRQMRPLLGAVTGALAGITLGGIYLIFAYLIAFPAGAVLGGMYGLAVGLIDALQVTVVTRLLYFPLSEPAKHRRAVVLMSVLFESL